MVRRATSYTVEVDVVEEALTEAAATDVETPWRLSEALTEAGVDDVIASMDPETRQIGFTGQVEALDAVNAASIVKARLVEVFNGLDLFESYPAVAHLTVYQTEDDE